MTCSFLSRARLTGAGAGFALLMGMAGCQKPAAGEEAKTLAEAQVKALDEEWSKAAEANDLERTVSYYADDAYLLPPNAPLATDKKAIRASWASLLGPGVKVSWKVTKVEAAQSGELVYLVGTYQLSMKDPQGKPIEDQGKLLEVWKKQANGQWKAVADTYNSDLPLAEPEPAKK
ncbi:MAG: DUF4440 domain-containing protein [Paludibaculum sp.]